MNIYELEDLLKGRIPKEDLKGKTFCFTGKCRKQRYELEELALNVGGLIKKSVVKNLSFLIIPDSFYSKTSKYYDAEYQGSKILTETEFLKMVQ